MREKRRYALRDYTAMLTNNLWQAAAALLTIAGICWYKQRQQGDKDDNGERGGRDDGNEDDDADYGDDEDDDESDSI